MFICFGILLILVTSTFGASLPTTFEQPELFKNDIRIIGGHKTSICKHKHQVSVRSKNNIVNAFKHICGGSIYKADIIITAAHCVFKRNPKSFAIVAGTNNREGGDGAIALVSKIIMHEKYNLFTHVNDIALMILSTPLPLNNVTTAPIALATEVPKHGAKALITGWGVTANGSTSDKLLEAEVRIISNERCNHYYADFYGPGRISESMICAGIEGVGGKDACQGDSGGPLVVNKQLTGIISWGNGCGSAEYPGVYSNVAFLRDWIEANAKENAA